MRFKSCMLGLAFLSLLSGLAAPGFARSRIKDVVDVEGVRENQLVGYGLVVGLNGTGDGLRNSPFTKQSLSAMLERLGVATRDQQLNTKNVAAVMVTANLPPFAMAGARVDVTISALGDAKSLQGGQLLVTPLFGADEQVYVVAQGPLAVGGFSAGGASGSSITQGVPTVGRIASGGIVEREIKFGLEGVKELRLQLRNPDFTTAQRIASKIDAFLGADAAHATNAANVRLRLPQGYGGDMAQLLAEIELLEIQPDRAAKIVVDDATGVVVIGDDVRVSPVAIAQGNLTVTVKESPQVSQPNPLAQGETVVVPQSDVTVEADKRQLAYLAGPVPLRDLVDGLNALGVAPGDLISILHALKAAGAIQAEIEVM